MKARVITGEIVTLRYFSKYGTVIDVNGRYYRQCDILEFIEESKEEYADALIEELKGGEK